MNTVVLLAAGTGSRMGHYAETINKVLLPVNGKAIISTVIEQFPESTHFVVALGYKGKLVEDYLSLAHPNLRITLVYVDDYEGPKAGPAHSLKCCRPHLTGPFFLVACDALYEGLGTIPTDTNYVSVARVTEDDSLAYCNIELDGAVVKKVVDKRRCDSGLAVSGAFFIKDTETFWSNLGDVELSPAWSSLECKAIELPWTDLGTCERYSAYVNKGGYDFSKTDEFIWFVNGTVIKWFKDMTITNSRWVKSQVAPDIFPRLRLPRQGFYSYPFIPGKTMYSAATKELFEQFLTFAKEKLWVNPHQLKLTTTMCETFYHAKTIKRLQLFRDKYPTFNPHVINGKTMKVDIDRGLQLIDWDAICGKNLNQRSAFIHGDLQFDNIIYSNPSFTFLDWRQDFAGEVFIGDLYYDIAKLKGGLLMNYDIIKDNAFSYNEDQSGSSFTWASRDYKELISVLEEQFPDPIIDQIVTLIFLNMAPLHTPPFDKLLFCLALERLNELA